MLPMTPPAIAAQTTAAGVRHHTIILQPEQQYTVAPGDVVEVPLYDGRIVPSTVSPLLRPLGAVKLPRQTFAIGNAKTSSDRGAAFLVLGSSPHHETIIVVLRFPELKIASASLRNLHYMIRVLPPKRVSSFNRPQGAASS
jgi:hypothetical protein